MKIKIEKIICDLCGNEINNCNNVIYTLAHKYEVCNKCYKENENYQKDILKLHKMELEMEKKYNFEDRYLEVKEKYKEQMEK